MALQDTLPPATRDEHLTYLLPGGEEGVCRVRLYQGRAGRMLLVCTELSENDGASVTAGATTLWPRAWTLMRRPWPALFIEHWPGANGDPDSPFAEQCYRVEFAGEGEAGLPVAHSAPRPGGGSPCFLQPRWRSLPLSEVRELAVADRQVHLLDALGFSSPLADMEILTPSQPSSRRSPLGRLLPGHS
jgi:hypothetical protein